MWKCPKCSRIFEKHGQMHSCRKKPLEEHFKNKGLAKDIFNSLVDSINQNVGKVEVISIPCCIHLFGKYDFLAALPKKNLLEIRFSLNRVLQSPRLKMSVAVSDTSYKNCIELESAEDINSELIDWIKEAYHLKNKEQVTTS